MTGSANDTAGLPSLAQGRLCLVLAALLWSLSGAFTKVLTWNSGLGLNTPLLDPWAIAFYRVLFAGVVIFLRVLRQSSSRWLTVLNHLGGALVLVPFIWHRGTPSWPQVGFLFLFGAVQMGFPYWLMARSLRVVSPQEAGTITLLEP